MSRGVFRVDPGQQALAPGGAPAVGAAAAVIAGGTPAGVGHQGTDAQGITDLVGAALANPHDGISAAYNRITRLVPLTNTDKGSTAVTAHIAATDPHGDRAFATAEDAAHVAAANPHPQYTRAGSVEAVTATWGFQAVTCTSLANSGGMTVSGDFALTGSLLLGNIIVMSTAGTAGLFMDTLTPQNRAWYSRTAGLNRWIFGTNSATESGSGAGSDFFVNRYNDAGTLLATAVSIARSNGYMTVAGGLQATALFTAGSATALSFTTFAAATGYTVVTRGTGSATGLVGFFSAGNVRQGYVGNATTTAAADLGTIPYVAGTHAFSGIVTVAGDTTVTGNFTATGNVTATGGATAATGRFSTDVIAGSPNAHTVQGFSANNVQSTATGGASGLSASIWNNSASGTDIHLMKSRGAVVNTRGVVQSSDVLAQIVFAGDDGTNFVQGAIIGAVVSATPGTNDMPSSLIFSTTADGASTVTERLRITHEGRFGFNTNGPAVAVDFNSDGIRVRTARTPASAAASGVTGEICWDANYVYVCTATNTWKRTALSTW